MNKQETDTTNNVKRFIFILCFILSPLLYSLLFFLLLALGGAIFYMIFKSAGPGEALVLVSLIWVFGTPVYLFLFAKLTKKLITQKTANIILITIANIIYSTIMLYVFPFH